MLRAKTIEQRKHIEDIVEEHLRTIYQDSFVNCKVYENDDNNIKIGFRCEDCYARFCVDIPFDMMAEIVDNLREQNNNERN